MNVNVQAQSILNSLQVVRTLTGTTQDAYKNMTNWGRACFSPDGQYVTAGGADASIFVWEAGTGRFVTRLRAVALGAPQPRGKKLANMTCVDWNRNGRQVASTDSDGNAHFWE